MISSASISTLIYNVQPTKVSPENASIAWHTDTLTDAKIEYGTTASYGLTVSNAIVTKEHTIALQNLTAGATYHYRVSSTDGSIVSGDYIMSTPHEFGVLKGSTSTTTNSTQLAAEYESGVRHKTLELAWDAYEPANNSFSTTYINAKKAELAAYKAQGFEVTLDLGSHYAPSWVTGLGANALYKNQYGDTYTPATVGKNIANGVFNNSVRTAMSGYMSNVFTSIGSDFYAIRAGGGYYGELHYPAESYSSHTNSFWGYDTSAQTGTGLPTGIPANPVPGWIPNPVRNGTFENGDDGSYSLSGTDSLLTTGAHRGSRSLQKVNPGAWSNETSQSNIQVVPGRTYNYSVWAKSTSGTAPACIQIRRPSNAEITLSCTGSSSYAQIAGSFTALDSTVSIALLTYDGTPTTLTYDDLSISASGYAYDATHANATSFINWYQNALVNFQNWQIAQYRSAGYSGKIFMMYPGFGVRNDAVVNQTADALNYDLSYTSSASRSGDLQQMTEWKSQVTALPADTGVYAYSTWIDGAGTDGSTDKAAWSPAKYLSYVAAPSSRGLYGENTGNNSYAQMQSAFVAMQSYGYKGIFWFNQSQLHGGTYASIGNYKTQISSYDHTAPYQASLTVNNGASSTTSKQVTLDLSAIDNVTNASHLQMRIAESPSFSGANYVPYTANPTLTLSDNYVDKTVYVSFKDEAGNESTPYRKTISYRAAATAVQDDAPSASSTATSTSNVAKKPVPTASSTVSSTATAVAAEASDSQPVERPASSDSKKNQVSAANSSINNAHTDQPIKKDHSSTLIAASAGIAGLLLVVVLIKTYAVLSKRK